MNSGRGGDLKDNQASAPLAVDDSQTDIAQPGQPAAVASSASPVVAAQVHTSAENDDVSSSSDSSSSDSSSSDSDVQTKNKKRRKEKKKLKKQEEKKQEEEITRLKEELAQLKREKELKEKELKLQRRSQQAKHPSTQAQKEKPEEHLPTIKIVDRPTNEPIDGQTFCDLIIEELKKESSRIKYEYRDFTNSFINKNKSQIIIVNDVFDVKKAGIKRDELKPEAFKPAAIINSLIEGTITPSILDLSPKLIRKALKAGVIVLQEGEWLKTGLGKEGGANQAGAAGGWYIRKIDGVIKQGLVKQDSEKANLGEQLALKHYARYRPSAIPQLPDLVIHHKKNMAEVLASDIVRLLNPGEENSFAKVYPVFYNTRKGGDTNDHIHVVSESFDRGYNLALMPFEPKKMLGDQEIPEQFDPNAIEVGKFYVRMHSNNLEYTVINRNGEVIRGLIEQQALIDILGSDAIETIFGKANPWTLHAFNLIKLEPYLPKILDVISERDNLHPGTFPDDAKFTDLWKHAFRHCARLVPRDPDPNKKDKNPLDDIPEDRPKLMPPYVSKAIADGIYDNLERLILASVIIDDPDTHSGNIGVVDSDEEEDVLDKDGNPIKYLRDKDGDLYGDDVPQAERETVKRKKLVRIDFAAAFKNYDGKLHFGSILRYLPFIGPTNHHRDYSRHALITERFAKLIDGLITNREYLRENVHKSIDKICVDRTRPVILEFAKHVGVTIENEDSLKDDEIINLIKGHILMNMDKRIYKAKNFAIQIRTSLCFEKDKEGNWVCTKENDLNKLIHDNPNYFYTWLNQGKNFHFRGEGQGSASRHLSQLLHNIIRKHPDMQDAVIMKTLEIQCANIESVVAAGDPMSGSPAAILRSENRVGNIAESHPLLTPVQDLASAAAPAPEPTEKDGQGNLSVEPVEAKKQPTQVISNKANDDARLRLSYQELYTEKYYLPLRKRVRSMFHEIFNDNSQTRLQKSSNFLYYVKSLIGYPAEGNIYNYLEFALLGFGLVTLGKNLAKLALEGIPAGLEALSAWGADRCNHYLDKHKGKMGAKVILAHIGSKVLPVFEWGFWLIRQITMRITSPIRSASRAYEFAERLYGVRVDEHGVKHTSLACKITGYTFATLSLAVSGAAYIAGGFFALPILLPLAAKTGLAAVAHVAANYLFPAILPTSAHLALAAAYGATLLTLKTGMKQVGSFISSFFSKTEAAPASAPSVAKTPVRRTIKKPVTTARMLVEMKELNKGAVVGKGKEPMVGPARKEKDRESTNPSPRFYQAAPPVSSGAPVVLRSVGAVTLSKAADGQG